jgi:TM2 domain-containing membrane protein YozV
MGEAKFYRSAFSSGLILGVILILYSMVLYVFEANVLSIGFGILNFVISIALFVVVMLLAGKSVRRIHLGGYMAYKDAFVFTLVVGITGTVLYAIFTYFYYAFADLSYLQNQVDEFLFDMQQRGLNESQLQDLKKQMEEQFSATPIKQASNSLLYNSITTVVLALLVSIFVKQNKPDYEEEISEI